jgi:hypothetical protein
MDMKSEGYGYDWDAKLFGGPADGCMDRVISINDKFPPKNTIIIIDGQEIKRESLGEKLIEYLTRNVIDDNQMVAVYELDEFKNNLEICNYKYVETLKFSDYRLKYN